MQMEILKILVHVFFVLGNYDLLFYVFSFCFCLRKTLGITVSERFV